MTNQITVPPLTISSGISSDILIEDLFVLKGPLTVDGGTVTGLTDPTQPTQPATKNYVDNLIDNVVWKDPVKVATTADVTLSGAQTIDGVAVVANDRVLVKKQTNLIQNGIYVVSATAWSRSVDMASGSAAAGVSTWVNEGTANADKSFICTDNAGADVVGTDPLTFVQFASGISVFVGDGLSRSGNTLSVNVDDATIEIVADTLQAKDSGITNAKLANSSITVTAGSGLTGGGLVTLGGTGTLNIGVDNTTLAVSADTLLVKDLGITNAKLANSALTVTAGAGLTGGGSLVLGESSVLFDVNTDNTTIEVVSDIVRLKDTAVTAGSYTKADVTVDAKGRLTAASSGTSLVSIIASLESAFTASTNAYMSWGAIPDSRTVVETLRLGMAGTIQTVTFTYIDTTAFTADPGELATFDIGTISGGSGTDPDDTFVVLAGGAAVVQWVEADSGTWPSTTATVSIPVLATTQLAIRVVETGGLTSATCEINAVIWIETD